MREAVTATAVTTIRFLFPLIPIAIGMLALAGWIFDDAHLRQGLAFSVAMNPVTVVCFVLLGMEALRFYMRNGNPKIAKAGMLAIWAVILAAASKLSDVYLGTSFDIDQWLFAEQLELETGQPNRMTPNTALCFFLLGCAMRLMHSRYHLANLFAQALIVVAFLFTLLVIVGYLYEINSFYGIGVYIPMAFNSAVAFMSLCVAVLFMRPRSGFMLAFASGGPAGRIAAILLPATLIVPFALGWISLKAQKAGLFDQSFSLVFSVLLDVSIFFSLSYIAVRSLYFSELERQKALSRLDEARAQAELANQAKDSFLATMSHEIRTPLTGMLGMLEMLSLTRLDKTQRETLEVAWASGSSLLRIVNDILDWSKIEEGKLELLPQPTSLQDLLQDVVNTYSRVASAKSLLLRQHTDPKLSLAHVVDGLRLSQILNNFVSNAIKFTPQGEIVVSAELLEHTPQGERIRFAVSDTGIGIKENVQKKLFQRYHQGDVDTERLYGGTGLGLAICRRLAEMMDGQIALQSVPGKGSTFSLTLTLPVADDASKTILTTHTELQQTMVRPLNYTGKHQPVVLAVDDHPTNRELLARQLELIGLQAEVAENGQTALNMWREGRFDLVITDCHMPEMDGYALTRAIRTLETEDNKPRTPVIAWTANALAEEVQRCLDAGMDELLTKPSTLAQLKQTLVNWLPIESGRQPLVPQNEPQSQEPGPIDFEVLGGVIPDTGKQMDILRDFIGHMRKDISRLQTQLDENDRIQVERTAHRMKGSSRMVGAVSVAKLCAAIEKAAAEDALAMAEASMQALEDTLGQLERWVAGLDNSTITTIDNEK